MSFLGGALVGGIVGLGLGVLLARSRRGRGAPADLPTGRRAARSRSGAVGVATVMAAAALVVSGIALERSSHHDSPSARAANPTRPTGTASPPLPPSTATPTTSLGTTVSVPNVVALKRDSAETSIKNAGLKAVVETLSLSNVPANFVISQNPLPAAQVPVGTSVSLVVSAAT